MNAMHGMKGWLGRTRRHAIWQITLLVTCAAFAEIAPGTITVFAMTSTSCPLSRKYLPRIVELAETSGDGIAWVLVNPVASDKPADMQAAAARLGTRALYVHDQDGRLAAAIDAVSTTEVFEFAEPVAVKATGSCSRPGTTTARATRRTPIPPRPSAGAPRPSTRCSWAT